MYLVVKVDVVGTCGPVWGRLEASTMAKISGYCEWYADNSEDSADDTNDDAYSRPFSKRARTRGIVSLSLCGLRRANRCSSRGVDWIGKRGRCIYTKSGCIAGKERR
jgi:hypothetical protein